MYPWWWYPGSWATPKPAPRPYAHTIASAQAKAMQAFDRFNDIVGTEKPPEKGMKKAAGN